MRVGIIAEGRGDLAVLTNILKGALNIEKSDVQYIRPEFNRDETDIAKMSAEQFGSWTLIKQDCCELSPITDFLEVPLDEERLLIIHLDTAEAELTGYEAIRPSDEDTRQYSINLRNNVIAKVREWMNNYDTTKIRFAIAVEETDAWLLTVYTSKGDTCHYKNPKERLHYELNRKLSIRKKNELFSKSSFERYSELSKPFRKEKELKKCAQKNHSLHLFYESLIEGSSTET